MREVGPEREALGTDRFDDLGEVLFGERAHEDVPLEDLARPAGERVERGAPTHEERVIHLAHEVRHPHRALLREHHAQVGEAFEEPVEDERGHRLHGRAVAPVVQPLERVVAEVVGGGVLAPLRARLRVLRPPQVCRERHVRLVEPRPERIEVRIGG